jgi:GntR family transcriptional regulator
MPTEDHASALDRESGVPLWRQLHEDLLRRLAAGEFARGFPGEVELHREYAVSRHTVRESLRRLREAGLVDSSRGRSSRVRTEHIEQPLGSLYSLFRQVESHGLAQVSRVLALDLRTDATAAGHLGRPDDEELLYLERVRLAGGEPLAHDRAWLPASVAAPLLEVDFAHAGLYDELTRTTGIRPTGGRERISAVAAGAAEEELLGIPVGSPCFAIERLGQVGDDPPIEYRRSVVRGDRYALLAAWTPRGYQLGARDL